LVRNQVCIGMNWFQKITQKSDYFVHLECLCADDFGASYKQDFGEELDENDIIHIQNYEETRTNHQRLASLASQENIEYNIQDTDDRDSKHSDAYLYFWWSQVEKILSILRESQVPGDVLDVPVDFSGEYESLAQSFGWQVERSL
jgi:hypothetical protein